MGEGEGANKMNKPTKTRAKELRKGSTEAERALWHHLRNRQLGGYKFRRQSPLGPLIVDFVCFEERVIIKLDGGHHLEQLSHDSERTAMLEEVESQEVV